MNKKFNYHFKKSIHFNRPVSRLGLDAVHLAPEYQALLAPVVPHQRLVAAPRHRHALDRQLLPRPRAAALHAHVHVAAKRCDVTTGFQRELVVSDCAQGKMKDEEEVLTGVAFESNFFLFVKL